MNSMEIYKVIALVLGATGFWKLTGVLIEILSNRKLKIAEAFSYQAQAEHQIIENWMQWSDTLEKRVKESIKHTKLLEKVIEAQKKQIAELIQQVKAMEKHNEELKVSIENLSEKTHEQ